MSALKSELPIRLLSRRALVQSLVGAGLLPACAGIAVAATRAGEVSEIQGRAEALTDENARVLAKSAAIYVNDLVRTGPQSRLSLKLGQRTLLKLGAETEIRIDKYLPDAGGEIELASGAIGFARTGRKSEEDVRIRSAYGLIAVRGTRFFAGPSRGQFGILVDEGRVAVLAAGVTVMLGPGEGTDVAAPGAPPSEPRRWPASRARALRGQLA